jgi:Zn-dependent protease
MIQSRWGFQWTLPLGPIKLSIDPLVPVIMGLLGWLFAVQYYPIIMEASQSIYWWAGGFTALGLFISILVHELGHASAATWRGQEVPQIHLFAFGGMAVLKNRKLHPLDEFLIAIAGPVMSLLLGGILWGIAHIPMVSDHVRAGVEVLGLLNGLIALFNIIPIYPLDGGRMLRAVLSMGKRIHLEASILTYRIGSLIIALLFISAIVLYVNQSYLISVGIGTAGFYLSYMALNGKYHLIHIPSLNKLFVRLPETGSTLSWIAHIFESDQIEVEQAWLPFRWNSQSELHVIRGSKYVQWASDREENSPGNESLASLVTPLALGRYIDIQDLSTYQKGVQFDMEFVPFLTDSRLIGICKAKEMQYWLQRKMGSEQAQKLLNQRLSSAHNG